MHSLITWIAYALGGLFFIACVVAWWEHLGRVGRPQDEPDWESPAPKAVTIDVELDALAAAGPGDQGERRQALGGALTRMAQPGTQGWVDTAPMILPGTSVAERKAQDQTARAG
jgi:hypothetical protein